MRCREMYVVMKKGLANEDNILSNMRLIARLHELKKTITDYKIIENGAKECQYSTELSLSDHISLACSIKRSCSLPLKQ